MSNAMIGYGSHFAIEDADSPGEYVDLAEVFNITPPSIAVDQVDVTHMQSPNRAREFISGLTDRGECSFEMNYVPGSTSDDRLLEIEAAGEVVSCRITFPNGAKRTFDGLLTAYSPTAPTDDKMTASVTFKVTGPVVAEDGSP